MSAARAAQIEADRLRAERNANAKKVGMAKGKGEDVAPLLAAGEQLGAQLVAAEAAINAAQEEVDALALTLPNLLQESVPDGADENANVEVRRWVRRACWISRRATTWNWASAWERGWISKPVPASPAAASSCCATRIARPASRLGPVHAGRAHARARLHRGVTCLTWHRRPRCAAPGQLPKFEQDLFAVRSEHNYYLIPTAEVPVTNLVREQILEAKELPLKLVAHTPCFRSEAGAAARTRAA